MCACWGFLYPFLQGKEEEKDHKKKKVTASLACSAVVQVNEERKREREGNCSSSLHASFKKKKGVTKCQKMREEKKNSSNKGEKEKLRVLNSKQVHSMRRESWEKIEQEATAKHMMNLQGA